MRDLLRQRCRLVRQRTANRLVLQNLLVRNTGKLIKGNALKKLTPDKLRETTDDEHLILALDTTYQVIEALEPRSSAWRKPSWPRASCGRSFGSCRQSVASGRPWL